jgi:hypothetical protein
MILLIEEKWREYKMTLFDDVKQKEKVQTFKKAIFFTVKLPGTYVIRVLEAPVLVTTHFVNGKYPIRCLGDNCPICERNRQLRNANPKVTDLREIQGYFGKQDRYMMNILDRSLVKVCPNCKAEHYAINGQFPSLCTCGTPIMNEKEHKSEQVKVMSMPIEKADSIKLIEKAVLGADGNPLGVDSFDLILLASVDNKKRINWTPMPNPASNDKIEVKEEDITPQDKFAITFNRDEVISLLKGITLKDIFFARGNDKPEGDSLMNPEVQKQLDSIFGS